MAGLGNDFDDVAAVQPVAQRHHPSVDFCANAAVPDLGVDGVGKINRRSFARKHHDLALGSKCVNLFGIKIDLQRRKKFVGIGNVALPFNHLPQPR